MSFVAGKSFPAYLCLFAFLRLGWGQEISNTSQMKAVIAAYVIACLPPEISPQMVRLSCPAPPQPVNGEWRIRKEFCEETHLGCKVPEGTELELSYELVFTCADGYRTNGDRVIYCRRNGKWSGIPSCIRIECGALNSVTRIAHCSRYRKTVNCDFPVLPGTQADLSCHPGYRAEDDTFSTSQTSMLFCNEEGEWEPQPRRCIPVCGRAAPRQKPLIIDGSDATVGEFPWHVSLYKQRSSDRTEKRFICGATLIQTNMVLTAAHCVYDETTETKDDPGRLFVMTGNIFRDFDDSRHDLNIVRKSRVKDIRHHRNFYGLRGNYASDIALLELEQPFVFSEILLPACLDTSGYSAPYLEAGAFGTIAGFGRTATDDSSPILQTITIPYVSYNECKNSKHAEKNQVFITKDKFCAGWTNGSVVCEGDSGGGIVFQKYDLWYVMGIVSVGLGVDIDNGETTCNRFSYTLFTRVSEYRDWIQQVIAEVKKPNSRLSEHRDRIKQAIIEVKEPNSKVSEHGDRIEQAITEVKEPNSKVSEHGDRIEQAITEVKEPASRVSEHTDWIQQAIAEVEEPNSRDWIQQALARLKDPNLKVSEHRIQIKQKITKVKGPNSTVSEQTEWIQPVNAEVKEPDSRDWIQQAFAGVEEPNSRDWIQQAFAGVEEPNSRDWIQQAIAEAKESNSTVSEPHTVL